MKRSDEVDGTDVDSTIIIKISDREGRCWTWLVFIYVLATFPVDIYGRNASDHKCQPGLIHWKKMFSTFDFLKKIIDAWDRWAEIRELATR